MSTRAVSRAISSVPCSKLELGQEAHALADGGEKEEVEPAHLHGKAVGDTVFHEVVRVPLYVAPNGGGTHGADEGPVVDALLADDRVGLSGGVACDKSLEHHAEEPASPPPHDVPPSSSQMVIEARSSLTRKRVRGASAGPCSTSPVNANSLP